MTDADRAVVEAAAAFVDLCSLLNPEAVAAYERLRSAVVAARSRPSPLVVVRGRG